MSVSYELVQNFEISHLVMAKVEKVNIVDIPQMTFSLDIGPTDF
jgi:hypothetical protein